MTWVITDIYDGVIYHDGQRVRIGYVDLLADDGRVFIETAEGLQLAGHVIRWDHVDIDDDDEIARLESRARDLDALGVEAMIDDTSWIRRDGRAFRADLIWDGHAWRVERRQEDA